MISRVQTCWQWFWIDEGFTRPSSKMFDQAREPDQTKHKPEVYILCSSTSVTPFFFSRADLPCSCSRWCCVVPCMCPSKHFLNVHKNFLNFKSNHANQPSCAMTLFASMLVGKFVVIPSGSGRMSISIVCLVFFIFMFNVQPASKSECLVRVNIKNLCYPA